MDTDGHGYRKTLTRIPRTNTNLIGENSRNSRLRNPYYNHANLCFPGKELAAKERHALR
jgi:hypothetical protein